MSSNEHQISLRNFLVMVLICKTIWIIFIQNQSTVCLCFTAVHVATKYNLHLTHSITPLLHLIGY